MLLPRPGADQAPLPDDELPLGLDEAHHPALHPLVRVGHAPGLLATEEHAGEP